MHLDVLKRLIGKEINIIFNRPIGTTHHKFKDTLYPVNYGYIDSVLGGDNEFQDAYILGETKPLETYRGKVIAIIHRFDDNEDKLVVYNYRHLSVEEIEKAVNFQDKYFKHEIITMKV